MNLSTPVLLFFFLYSYITVNGISHNFLKIYNTPSFLFNYLKRALVICKFRSKKSLRSISSLSDIFKANTTIYQIAYKLYVVSTA